MKDAEPLYISSFELHRIPVCLSTKSYADTAVTSKLSQWWTHLQYTSPPSPAESASRTRSKPKENAGFVNGTNRVRNSGRLRPAKRIPTQSPSRALWISSTSRRCSLTRGMAERLASRRRSNGGLWSREEDRICSTSSRILLSVEERLDT